MLKKRIIPCLDIKDGRTVKGTFFENIKDAGDPVVLAQKYSIEGADELVFLDITATQEKRKTFTQLVHQISTEINIPFTVGGGIHSISDVENCINAGADKVSINSAAIKNPELITSIAKEFGSQCTVLAVDVKKIGDQWMVFSHGGKVATSLTALEWVKKGVELGAGEILLTSMSNDGTKSGFATPIIQIIAEQISVPVIASGGAGMMSHFQEIFTQTKATGALAASIFHYDHILIPELKQYLNNQNILVRL